MSRRPITFSTKYPHYHPRKFESTYFVEKLFNWYWENNESHAFNVQDLLIGLNGEKFSEDFIDDFCANCISEVRSLKYHTLRKGNRWKAGDKMSPRIWTGTPYYSKQLIILPDIEIVKVWDVEIKRFHTVSINGKPHGRYPDDKFIQLANNDGLDTYDFKNWIKEGFKGQIICWEKNIDY